MSSKAAHSGQTQIEHGQRKLRLARSPQYQGLDVDPDGTLHRH